MKKHITKVLAFSFALAMAAPAVQGWEMEEAHAMPGNILNAAFKGGKRTHRKATTKKSTRKSSKNKKSTSTTRTTRTTRRTTTNRRTVTRSPRTRTVTRTRRAPTTRRSVTTHHTRRPTTRERTTTTTSRRNGRTTTTTTTTTRRTRRPRTVHRRHNHRRTYRHTAPRETHVYHHTAPRRTTVHHHRAPVRRRTTVHHHHHHPNSGGATVVRTQPRQQVAPRPVEDPTTAYLTAGLGVSGLAASSVSKDALPGVDFNVGLGGRSGWMAAELGFTMGGYRLDPKSDASNVTTLGLTADVKLQPTFSILEPYVSLGVGGHVLNDHFANNSAMGGSVRLGAGVDIRLDEVAIGVQYMQMHYGMANNSDKPLSAATETVGMGLKFYF